MTTTPNNEALAARLEAFRREHWMHWSNAADNELVCECIAALSSGQAASAVPAGATKCPNCFGAGVIGSPGQPCPLCKLTKLGDEYAALGGPSKEPPGVWCQYVAGMIVAYLGGPVDDKRITPIAGIIERRLHHLSPATPAAPAQPREALAQAADETAWLIENHYDGRLHYLSVEDGYLCHGNIDAALRFARKEDAEALFEHYARDRGLAGNHRFREAYRIAEHMWPALVAEISKKRNLEIPDLQTRFGTYADGQWVGTEWVPVDPAAYNAMDQVLDLLVSSGNITREKAFQCRDIWLQFFAESTPSPVAREKGQG